MTRPKRFRGMELTEGEVATLIYSNDELCERHMSWCYDPDGLDEVNNDELDRFVDRAKRLLPLWRKAGLKRLESHAWGYGFAAGRNLAIREEVL